MRNICELFTAAVIFEFLLSMVASSNSPSTLQLVNLVYRHGDRAPMYTFPTNKVPVSAWPQGLGSLTKLGMQQQFALGQFVRQYYADFLNDSYLHDQVRVRSTDVDRTLMSAESHLAGLYPPVSSQLWNPSIPWQPIPVHTVLDLDDGLLEMGASCPYFDKLYNEILASPAVQTYIRKHQALFTNLSKYTGMEVNITNIWMIYDALLCQAIHNYTKPEWLTPSLNEETDAVTLYEFVMHYANDRTIKLKGGSLLQAMTDNMLSKSHGLPLVASKLFMYSAHDDTVTALLHAMHAYTLQNMVPYCAAAFVELHKDENNEYFVNVLYKNSSLDPHLLTVRGCSKNCPLDKFIDLTKSYACRNFSKACSIHQSPSTQPQTDVRSFSLISALIGASMLLGIFIFIVVSFLAVRSFCARRRKVKYGMLGDDELSGL